MRKLVCILAVGFAAVAWAPEAFAQSTWTVKPVLKRLDGPTGNVLEGVAYVPKDVSGQLMHIGVFLEMHTNRADATEGLTNPTIAGSHWNQAFGSSTPRTGLIGLDTLVGGVYFSGTGTGVTQSTVDTYVRGVNNSQGPGWTNRLIAAGFSNSNSLVDSYSRAIIDAGQRPQMVMAYVGSLRPWQIRGIWGEPDANGRVEIQIGVIELPVHGMPDGLDTLTISWGDVTNATDGWKASASHRRGNVVSESPGPGDTITYNLYTGERPVTDYVSFLRGPYNVDEARGGYDVTEGTDDGDSNTTDYNEETIYLEFGRESGALAADINIPITLTRGTAPAAGYIVTSLDGSTTIIDSSDTSEADLTFNVTIPSGQGGPGVAPYRAAGFKVRTVPNSDDVPEAMERTRFTLSIGDVSTVGGLNPPIEVGAHGTTTVTIVDDDAPSFTANLSVDTSAGPSTAREGAATADQLMLKLTVAVEDTNGDGHVLEHPATFTFAATSGSTPAATVTGAANAVDFIIPRDVIVDQDSNNVFEVTYDSTTGMGTITLHGSIGEATDNLVFPVVAVDDDDQDVGERVTLTVNPVVGRVDAGTAATVPITDNDSNEIRLELSETGGTEGAAAVAVTQTITATVVLSDEAGNTGDEDWTVNVSIDTAASTASASDYNVDTGPFAITIPAGTLHNGTATYSFTTFEIIADDVVEGSETIVFNAAVVTGTTPTTVAGVAIEPIVFTIADQATDTAELTLANVTGSEAVDEAAGNNANFVVTVGAAVGGSFSVDWEVDVANSDVDDDDFARDQATGGLTTSGRLTFDNPAASATANITIPVADDDLSEGAELIQLSLTVIEGDLSSRITVADLSQAGSKVTINANDALTVALTGPAEANEGGSGVYTATLSGGVSTTDITVPLTLGTTVTGAGKVAATIADFADPANMAITALPSIVISARSASESVRLYFLSGDTDEGGNDVAAVTLGAPTGASGAITADTNANVVETAITEHATVDLTLSSTTITEPASGGTATITGTVSVDGTVATTDDIEIAWTLEHDDTVAADFGTTTSGSVTFTGGNVSSSQTFTIDIAPDDISEADEEFDVVISVTTTGAAVTDLRLGTDRVTATISQNDAVTLAITGAATAAEGTEVTYTVTASGGTIEGSLRLTPTLIGSGAGFVDTTSGTDWEFPGSSVATIAAGATEGTFTVGYVREIGDTREGQETAEWSVTPVAGQAAYVDTTQTTTATTAVIDNLIQVSDATVTEGTDGTGQASDQNIEFTVSIYDGDLNDDNDTDDPAEVAIATGKVQWELVIAGETAVEADFGTLPAVADRVFDLGGANGFTHTISIPINNDGTSEAAETFKIRLSQPSGNTDGLWDAVAVSTDHGGEAEGVISPSDPVTLTLTGPATAEEGGEAATYTVNVTGADAITEDIQAAVTISGLAGAADAAAAEAIRSDITQGSDLPIPVTIAVGASPLSFDVTVNFDADEDGDPEPETEDIVFVLVQRREAGVLVPLGGSGHTENAISLTANTVTTAVTNVAGNMDVNGDGMINGDDGLLLYFSLAVPGFFGDVTGDDPLTSVRSPAGALALAGSRLGTGQPRTEEHMLASLNRVQEIIAAAGDREDVNGDGALNGDDGLMIYFALAVPGFFGDVTAAQPLASVRNPSGALALAGSRLGAGQPRTEEHMLATLNKVRELIAP